MAKGYEAPHEVRELEKLINDFTYTNGLEVMTVFRDFLRYIIHGFSLPDTPPLADWRYTKEQNKTFAEMLIAWIRIMDTQIKIHGYYDALGTLFTAFSSHSSKQDMGQFFTPKELSDLCELIIMRNEPQVHTVYDPAVGSGSMLIATKTDHPRSYLVGWDLDYTCCLMCVCNFLMNSCVGEVVCIDSLTLQNFRGAWIVNEAYYRTELPSVRWLNEQEYLQYKQAKIPAYVYFLDQKNYDDYFKMREACAFFMNLITNNKQT